MHPLPAALLVLVGTFASLALIRLVYQLERNHPPRLRILVVVGIWFLATYTFMAFAIRPH